MPHVRINEDPNNPLTVDGTVNVGASALPNGAATHAAQTDGSQKTQIAEGANVAAVIAGANTGVKGLRVYGGPTDPISDIPVGILLEEHQVHEGESYQWFNFATLNAGTRDIRISVPNLAATTRTPHLIPEVICDATTTTLYFYEGTTWTAGGTDDSAKIMNRNRNSANVPGTKIYLAGGTPLTPNALGTLFYQGYLFTGKAGTVAERAIAEWVLKTSTEYLFRIVTTGNGMCLVRFHFYEDLGV